MKGTIEIEEDIPPEMSAALARAAELVVERAGNGTRGVMLSVAVTVLSRPGGCAVSVMAQGTCTPEVRAAVITSVADVLDNPRDLPVIQ